MVKIGKILFVALVLLPSIVLATKKPLLCPTLLKGIAERVSRLQPVELSRKFAKLYLEALAGDNEAGVELTQLFKTIFGPKVRRYGFKSHIVEDVLQEALSSAMTNKVLANFDPDQFYGYLQRIVRNKCIDLIRNSKLSKNRPTLKLQFEADINETSSGKDATTKLDEAEQEHIKEKNFIRFLKNLTPLEVKLLEVTYSELSAEEILARLRKSIDPKTTVSDIKKSLDSGKRKLLDGSTDEDLSPLEAKVLDISTEKLNQSEILKRLKDDGIIDQNIKNHSLSNWLFAAKRKLIEMNKIQNAWEELSPNKRTQLLSNSSEIAKSALQAYFVDEKSFNEIAKNLDMTEQNIKKILKDAIGVKDKE